MKNKNAFTLLELLVVIGIIGVLVSLAMVSYTSAQRKSRDSRRQADMKAIQGALDVYYSETASLNATFENAVRFDNICEDTCTVYGFDKKNYKISFEIDDVISFKEKGISFTG